MKVAIAGSRQCKVDDAQIRQALPQDTTVIISGGAKGVDSCAKAFAARQGIAFIEFRPDYRRYGKGAPLKRNEQMIDAADLLVAFWDGASRGTAYTIQYAQKQNKAVKVIDTPGP